MSAVSPFSPTLTATSSTSRPRTDIDILPDLAMDGVGVPDINDLFNFDEYESANDVSFLFLVLAFSWRSDRYLFSSLPSLMYFQSHSPSTLSPNRTPSPLIAARSPVAITAGSPSFDFNRDLDFSFDFMADEKSADPFAANAIAGPSSFPITPFNLDAYAPQTNDLNSALGINVKQEPVDMWANQTFMPETRTGAQATSSAAIPTNDLTGTAPINFNGLPLDQQAALQQLMLNIMTYQAKFGMQVDQTPSVVNPPTTIEPSMIFSNPSSLTSSGQSGSSISPTSGFTTASSSFSPSISTSEVATGARSTPSASAIPIVVNKGGEIEEDEEDDEQLVAVDPNEQPLARGRADSTFSFGTTGDIDSRLDRLAPLSSIFLNGKGKGGKKGGGLSSVVRQEDEDVDDDDSWRPSPEEYKKLSSKEKRQLRNKLSARAFRNRRKDYIGTLEGHIKERDGVIDEMRAELSSSRTENQDLR